MADIPNLKALAGPRCGNCKFSAPREVDDGFICRRGPPTIQMIPLVSVTILPYVMRVKGWGKPPPELADAVLIAQQRPVFYPMVNWAGVYANDTCGEHKPKIHEASH